jgi:hypothetical protein
MKDLLSPGNYEALIDASSHDKTDIEKVLNPVSLKRDFDDEEMKIDRPGSFKPIKKPKIVEPPRNNTSITSFFGKK